MRLRPTNADNKRKTVLENVKNVTW